MTRHEELIKKHPVRRSEAQKAAFREYVLDAAKERGVDARVEKSSDGKNQNVIIGNVERADVVLTAHYDTPAASLFPNIMIPRNIPLFFAYQMVPVLFMLIVGFAAGFVVQAVVGGEDMRAFAIAFLVTYYALFFIMFRGFSNKNNYNDNTSGVATVLSVLDRVDANNRDKVAFILFDNEEKGKKGAKAYFKDHKDFMSDKLLINFDCVGDGNEVVFIAMKNAEEKSGYKALSACFEESSGYTPHFYSIKGSESNSDYKVFPCGVGCMVCRKSKGGLLYTPRIHTKFDTIANNSNIEYISDGIINLVNKIS